MNPICHYCQQRIAVTGLVRMNGRLERPAEWKLPFRRFATHDDPNGKPCAGSSQTLAVARGREPDDRTNLQQWAPDET